MKSCPEIGDLLRYSLLPAIGPSRGRALIAAFGSFPELRKHSLHDLLQVHGFNRTIAGAVHAALHDEATMSAIERTVERNLARVQAMHVDVLTCFDERFPAMLRDIYDPPLFLFVHGSLPKDDDIRLGVVGTRFTSEYGEKAAAYFVRDLCRAGIVIVSGLARGIDTVAHATTIAQGGTTIAVLGSGLDRVYPESNTRLARAIADHGCVISEYLMGAKPDHVNFPRRNRIISGLSAGVLVVETGVKGGAMITARFALDQNREVFAVPGNIFRPNSAGTSALIRAGTAQLVTCADDILAELPNPGVRAATPPQPARQLTLQEQEIMNCIGDSPTHIDDIAQTTLHSQSDLLVLLLQMEMKNILRQLPGKYFVRQD